MSILPEGPWDDLRRKVEQVLGLPNGSTNPNSGFKWDLPSPPRFMKEVEAVLKNLLRRSI